MSLTRLGAPGHPWPVSQPCPDLGLEVGPVSIPDSAERAGDGTGAPANTHPTANRRASWTLTNLPGPQGQQLHRRDQMRLTDGPSATPRHGFPDGALLAASPPGKGCSSPAPRAAGAQVSPKGPTVASGSSKATPSPLPGGVRETPGAAVRQPGGPREGCPSGLRS